MIMTFHRAVKYLEQYVPTPDKKHPGKLGLKRMQYFMDLLGNPQLKYPTIHVGGTSGKGSTSTIIASILATKFKVGVHTSPHLVKINERIKVSKQTIQTHAIAGECMVLEDIPDMEFMELLKQIIPVIQKVEKSKFGPPSYFEIVVAMAFLHFSQKKVDIAVIEVGMGGRFDATNVIKPEVVVLTNVGLDHTEILGDTVEKIAKDKVGIIRPGIQVVSGVKQPSVISIIEEKCKKEKAPLSLLQIPPPQGNAAAHPWGVFEAFSYKIKKIDQEGSVFDYNSKSGSDLPAQAGLKGIKGLILSLLGEHQIENAALAIRAVELLNNPITQLSNNPINSQIINEENVRNGIMYAFIPGRLEVVNRNPLIILDGAHNPDKVRALVRAIKRIFPKKKVTSIIAIKSDKSVKDMLVRLLKISDRIIFTKFQLKGDVGIISSYDPKLLLLTARNINIQHRYSYSHSRVAYRGKNLSVIESPKEALSEVIKKAEADSLILVTGSLYLVGEIKQSLASRKLASSYFLTKR